MNPQTDRELLELAARASGFRGPEHKFCWTENEYPRCSGTHGALWNYVGFMDSAVLWNPLTDDGDALRLAVELRLVIDTDYNNGAAVGSAYLSMDEFHEHDCPSRFGADRAAAARRAITRAAAEVAKAGG